MGKINLAIALFCLFLFSCRKEPAASGNNYDPTVPLGDTLLKNVSYGNHVRQVYDIYLPANRDTGTPVLLMIHGGGWRSGQKEDMLPYYNRIRSKWSQVAVVNMNYRLASNAAGIHHDEIMSDIASVVSQLNVRGSDYRISNKLGIMGASAGGQLAMIYAYRYHSGIKCVGNVFGPSIINDWSWYNSTNLWLGSYTGDILSEYVGRPWDTTIYKSVSPYWNIHAGSQPTIIFHGNLDPVVPVYQSHWLHNKLNNLGVLNRYHEYVAFHSFENNQLEEVATRLVEFFKTHVR